MAMVAMSIGRKDQYDTVTAPAICGSAMVEVFMLASCPLNLGRKRSQRWSFRPWKFARGLKDTAVPASSLTSGDIMPLSECKH
jgi:hypothetical protein